MQYMYTYTVYTLLLMHSCIFYLTQLQKAYLRSSQDGHKATEVRSWQLITRWVLHAASKAIKPPGKPGRSRVKGKPLKV